MKKLFFLIILIVFIFLNQTANVFAGENSAGSSAGLNPSTHAKKEDIRTKVLKDYLESYSSELSAYAEDFIEYADFYNLDWKLVAAISGVESTFGSQIPYNSFNAWGWGVYGDNVIRFSSWKEGIQAVSEGLRTNYMDKWGATGVYEIGRIYAQSPTWASKVTYFMDKISEYASQNHLTNLPLSI